MWYRTCSDCIQFTSTFYCCCWSYSHICQRLRYVDYNLIPEDFRSDNNMIFLFRWRTSHTQLLIGSIHVEFATTLHHVVVAVPAEHHKYFHFYVAQTHDLRYLLIRCAKCRRPKAGYPPCCWQDPSPLPYDHHHDTYMHCRRMEEALLPLLRMDKDGPWVVEGKEFLINLFRYIEHVL